MDYVAINACSEFRRKMDVSESSDSNPFSRYMYVFMYLHGAVLL